MSIALDNGSRKRINMIARVAVDELLGKSRNRSYTKGGRRRSKKNPRPSSFGGAGYTALASEADIKAKVGEVAARWESVKNSGAKARAAAGFGRQKPYDGPQSAAFYAGLPASDPALKSLRSKVKREAANAFGLTQNHATRGKGLRYYQATKVTPAQMMVGGKKRTFYKRNVPQIREYNRGRASLRQRFASEGRLGRGARNNPWYGSNAPEADMSAKYGAYSEPPPGQTNFPDGPYKVSGYILANLPEPGPSQPYAKAFSKAKRRAGMGKRRKGKASQAQLAALARGRAKRKANLAARKNVSALANVSALQNPGFAGVTSFITGYAVPVTLAGAAAGAAHAFASSAGVTERIAGTVAMIPVVGTFAADNMPYTLQGITVGALLAAAAPMVGGTAGKYLALTGGAAIVFGGGIDAFNYVAGGADASSLEDELLAEGDLDFDDMGALALGDLALENMGDLALENPFATPSLEAPSPLAGHDDLAGDYGQSSLADAYYSGADFSGEEGQALLNGARSWRARFGRPSVRMAQRRAGGPSHMAGKAGHRWGWLIRTVGPARARKICSLPPKQRLGVIHKLRKAAIAAYEQALLESKAVEAEASSPDAELIPAAGTVPGGATGAEGVGGFGYLGTPDLFMGA